mmetsp:Transcript_8107/g.7553  ORF Transcript_8107/g.7553 Transcript_8107/m.7553 type:complete len:99 (-) Transcript_8107:24-320(-)
MLILLALWGQLAIGVSAVWYPNPLELAALHQIGAMTLMTATIYGLHTCRKVDPRHIRNLMGKLKVENPEGYKQLMTKFDHTKMSKKDFEAAKQYYEGK